MEKREMRGRYLWIQYEIADNPNLSGSDILVYMALARFVDNNTQTCFPSNKKIVEYTRLSNRTVYDSIKKLEEQNIIKVEREFGRVNNYCLLHIETAEKYTSENISLVKNNTTTSENEHLVPVKNNTTNNTYINNTYLTIPNKEISKESKQLTDLLYTKVRENHSFIDKKPNTKDYGVLDSLLKKYPPEIVEGVICWSQQDDFWKSNVRSASGLKKHFETLLAKIETKQQRKGIRLW